MIDAAVVLCMVVFFGVPTALVVLHIRSISQRTASIARDPGHPPWWPGRCREIADAVNFGLGSSGIGDVTPAQVEQVLFYAERLRKDYDGG